MPKTHTFKYKIPNTEIELEVNCTTLDNKEHPKVISERYETTINSIFYNGVNVFPLLEVENLIGKIYVEADVDGYRIYNEL